MSLNLAGCVILDENKKMYLLHRNKKGVTQWELPGGKVEPEETVERAAVRELHEELGVEVKLVKNLGKTSFEENGMEHIYVWFKAEVLAGKLSVCEPETFDELRSFSLDELSGLELSNNMKKLHEVLRTGKVDLA